MEDCRHSVQGGVPEGRTDGQVSSIPSSSGLLSYPNSFRAQTPFVPSLHSCPVSFRAHTLLSQTANVLKLPVQKQDGVYPLGLATFRGRLDIVRLLLRHGARVDTHGPGGPTALHTACVGGHLSIVKALVAAGADPKEIDDKNQSALHWVAHQGSIQVSKRSMLGADPGGGGGEGVGGIDLYHFPEYCRLRVASVLCQAPNTLDATVDRAAIWTFVVLSATLLWRAQSLYASVHTMPVTFLNFFLRSLLRGLGGMRRRF